MDIFLDNQPFETDASTLGDVLLAAQERIDPTGRIIVEVRVDGDILDHEAIDNLEHEPLAFDELQLITAVPHELAVMTFSEVAEALAGAAEAQQKAADALSTDQPEQAMEHVADALSVWTQAQQSVLTVSQLLEMNLDDVDVDGTPAPQIINALAQQLAQIRDQLIHSDWVALADTLGYEMTETADRWTKMLQQLTEVIQAESE